MILDIKHRGRSIWAERLSAISVCVAESKSHSLWVRSVGNVQSGHKKGLLSPSKSPDHSHLNMQGLGFCQVLPGGGGFCVCVHHDKGRVTRIRRSASSNVPPKNLVWHKNGLKTSFLVHVRPKFMTIIIFHSHCTFAENNVSFKHPRLSPCKKSAKGHLGTCPTAFSSRHFPLQHWDFSPFVWFGSRVKTESSELTWASLWNTPGWEWLPPFAFTPQVSVESNETEQYLRNWSGVLTAQTCLELHYIAFFGANNAAFEWCKSFAVQSPNKYA